MKRAEQYILYIKYCLSAILVEKVVTQQSRVANTVIIIVLKFDYFYRHTSF